MDTRAAERRATAAEKRKEELGWTVEQPLARDWGADGSAKAEELAPGLAEDNANKRGCKSAAQVWMSLLSLCDRMCGSAAWLVLFTCLHGVRSLRVHLVSGTFDAGTTNYARCRAASGDTVSTDMARGTWRLCAILHGEF